MATSCYRFLTDCLGTLLASAVQYRRCSSGATDPAVVIDQIDTRLVRLELQDRHCLSDARRHRASGAKGLFRARMLEHRRVLSQMAQLQRFRETAMAQFDALSNHELNRSFIRAMQSLVGDSKDRAAAAREDAETVMEDFHESVSQVKDLSDFLGQPLAASSMAAEEVTDEELDAELSAQYYYCAEPAGGVSAADRADDPPPPARAAVAAVEPRRAPLPPVSPLAAPSVPSSGVERMLVLPAMLNSR